jgi:hypothetical protein
MVCLFVNILLIERENFGKDDIKETDGVLLAVDSLGSDVKVLEQRSAEEYQPGGQLLITLQVLHT